MLDDLSVLSLEELTSRSFHAFARLVQLALWSSRSLARLVDAAPLMGQIVRSLERNEPTRLLQEKLYMYLLCASQGDVDEEKIRTILFDVAGVEGREEVMNAGEQLMERGRVEGRIEGLRAAICTTLAARGLSMSERAQVRLGTCTDATRLTHWLARSAVATSENDVFALPDSHG